MKSLNELAKAIHENAKAKGFYDVERNEGEIYMLIVSELGEALEAHRKGNFADLAEYNKQVSLQSEKGVFQPIIFQTCIKDSFSDEIADTITRILDYMYYKNPKFEIKIHLDLTVEKNKNVGEFLFEVVGNLFHAYVKASLQMQLYILCNVLSRLFIFCENQKIDIMKHIELKMQYNSTRKKLHGKAY